MISWVTRSIWTHSALYIGKLGDHPQEIQQQLLKYNSDIKDGPLIIESNLGQGVVVRKLECYRKDHLRICRPMGIKPLQVQKVLDSVINDLGMPYDHLQVFDLARFLFPWFMLPRRWRSSLFKHNAKAPTKHTCSLLIAEAFVHAHFPILPILEKGITSENYKAVMRNPRLFVPADFDYSPFFGIVKYPIIELADKNHANIFWNQFMHCDDEECL